MSFDPMLNFVERSDTGHRRNKSSMGLNIFWFDYNTINYNSSVRYSNNTVSDRNKVKWLQTTNEKFAFFFFFTYGRSLLCQRLVCSYQTNEIVTLCCPTSTPRLRESSKRCVFHYFCTLLWIWVCLSMPAFVSRERRAWDDSLSLNNINRRCEMISDSACCLCSVLCIYQLSQHLITSTLLLSGVCNKEGRKELREGEGERERAEEGCFSGVWRQHHTTHLWRWFTGDQLWMSGANWIGCSNKCTSSSFFGKRMTMEFALLHHFPPTTPPYNSRLCFPSFPFCSISPGSRCGAERVLVVPTDKR